MKISIPRAIIFDWDNTLVDSWPAIAESINYVREKYGQPVWTYQEVVARCTRSARESFPQWFGDQASQASQDFYTHFQKTRARLGTKPLNGAIELLKWLKQQHIPALVVSNKKGDYLRQECAQLGWDDYFVGVAGAGDAARDKPAREHADHALTQAGLTGNPNIWFVGDSEVDIACARNADCTPVLLGDKTLSDRLNVAITAPDCAALLSLLTGAAKE